MNQRRANANFIARAADVACSVSIRGVSARMSDRPSLLSKRYRRTPLPSLTRRGWGRFLGAERTPLGPPLVRGDECRETLVKRDEGGETFLGTALPRRLNSCRKQPMRWMVTAMTVLVLTSSGWAIQDQSPPKTDKKDRELSKKLLNKTGQPSDESVMEVVIRLMADAAARLEIRFDTGEDTLGLQDDILARLDEAIELAASQRRRSRNSQEGAAGDRRRQLTKHSAQRQKDQTGKGEGKGQTDGKAPSDNTIGEVTNSQPGGDMLDTRRGWGHLPQRERDEIIQGVGERYLQRYRAWIEKYYRALRDRDEGGRP